MKFFSRRQGSTGRLGILPGAFNPVTIAHVALIRAASPWVDEVVLVLPRALPHKEYVGASFSDRVEMLRETVGDDPRCSIAASDRGLFVEIAEECRMAYGDEVRLSFLCGRDAAERIAVWDYGRPGAFAEMLRQFDLLVADRGGEYQPPPEYLASIRRLPISGEYEHVSASEVRARIERGEPWEHLVPAAIHDRVGKIYR